MNKIIITHSDITEIYYLTPEATKKLRKEAIESAMTVYKIRANEALGVNMVKLKSGYMNLDPDDWKNGPENRTVEEQQEFMDIGG